MTVPSHSTPRVRGRCWRPPTRAAVIYVIAMLCLGGAIAALARFDDGGHVQDVLVVVFMTGLLPAGLIVVPLWFPLYVVTGGYLGGGVPYSEEVMLAVTVLGNAALLDRVTRRRRTRRTEQTQ